MCLTRVSFRGRGIARVFRLFFGGAVLPQVGDRAHQPREPEDPDGIRGFVHVQDFPLRVHELLLVADLHRVF